MRARLRTYDTDRRRVAPPDMPFADRTLREPTELTSRVSTDKVAAAKEALSKPATAPDGVDVALATNMISVGLDITRLGLMLVQGQPKTAAEYIQATSRVGRDKTKPGLVLAVLNAHKPRDRMHYEGFRHFHACFYRAVEATSVTPWAARALDRALAAVIVAIARHLDPAMVAESAAATLARHPEVRVAVREALLARAPDGAVAGGRAALAEELDELLDGWEAVARDYTDSGDGFQYTKPSARALLHQPLDPAIENLINPVHRRFVAGRSMRDVEASSPVRVCGPSWEALS